MRRVVASLALYFYLIAIPVFAFSSTMHVLIVGDTDAEELRESIEEDLINIKQEMFTAATHCGLGFSEQTYSGEEASPKSILTAVQQLSIHQEDAVVFYFSGHGYRVPSKKESPWPNLAFTRNYEGLDLDDILEVLREKKPRFILVIADCCNNYIPEVLAPFLIRREFDLRSVKPWVKRNYQQLFKDVSGEVIVSASKPGLYAWSTTKGGLYTIAFIASLHTELNTKKGGVSWHNILDRTAYIISDHQTPEYLVN